MKEENIIKIVKLGTGCYLVTLYAVTGANGLILGIAAFLLGFPIEKLIDRYLESREKT